MVNRDHIALQRTSIFRHHDVDRSPSVESEEKETREGRIIRVGYDHLTLPSDLFHRIR